MPPDILLDVVCVVVLFSITVVVFGIKTIKQYGAISIIGSIFWLAIALMAIWIISGMFSQPLESNNSFKLITSYPNTVEAITTGNFSQANEIYIVVHYKEGETCSVTNNNGTIYIENSGKTFSLNRSLLVKPSLKPFSFGVDWVYIMPETKVYCSQD